MYIPLTALVIFCVFALVVAYQFHKIEIERERKYVKEEAKEGLYSDLAPVARVLNIIYEASGPNLHPNIRGVHFAAGHGLPAGACVMDVLFEDLNNKIQADEEMHKLTFSVKQTVQGFFNDGLVLPDDKSKDIYFNHGSFGTVALSPEQKFYYKEIWPVFECAHCLKNRLHLLTFIVRYKHNSRIFYTDFFGVYSADYKEAVKQFNKRYKEFCADEKDISVIENDLLAKFPELKPHFNDVFYWLKKSVLNDAGHIADVVMHNHKKPIDVFYGMLLAQTHLQITLGESKDLFNLWDYLAAKAREHNSFPDETIKEMSAKVAAKVCTDGK